MSKLSRVLIINQHSINVGDEAAGCALLMKLVEGHNVERIDVIYNGSEQIPYDNELVNHNLDVTLKNMGYAGIFLYLTTGKIANESIAKYISLIKRADLILVAPSGANLGIYRDWRFLTRLLFVVKADKTPVFHWNTVGASGSRIFDCLSTAILKRSRLYVREKKSQDYLRTLGLHSELGPDTAFLLDSLQIKDDRNCIAFVPTPLDSWHPAFRKNPIDNQILNCVVKQIANFAITNHYSIKILPHLRDEKEEEYNKMVVDRLKSFSVPSVHVSSVKNYRDYDREIASSTMVIGMRYHTVVLAAKNYKPYIALAYENKSLEVSRYTDMADYAINLQGDRKMLLALEAKLLKLNANKEQISVHLHKTVREKIRPRASYVLENELPKQ